MKSAALIILFLALAAAVALGLVSRKSLVETRELLETERASRLSIERELELARKDPGDFGRKVRRPRAEVEAGEAESGEITIALTGHRDRSEKRMLQLETDLQEVPGSPGRHEKDPAPSIAMESLRDETRELKEKAQGEDGELETMRNAYESLLAELREELKRREVRIEQVKELISVEVLGSILFPAGTAAITPEGEKVLWKVGEALKSAKDRPVRVVGHTDNVPIREEYRSVYPTNWELSAARASSVVRFFQHRIGMPPSHLEAVGRSSYEPVAGNDTPEGRELNRRVTILIGPKLDMP